MKYFKAPIRTENGQKVYGTLPHAFVIGYESDTEAFFELMDEVYVPSNANVTEITYDEFQLGVETIKQIIEQKKQEEYQNSLQEMERQKQDREQRIADLEMAISELLSL